MECGGACDVPTGAAVPQGIRGMVLRGESHSCSVEEWDTAEQGLRDGRRDRSSQEFVLVAEFGVADVFAARAD